MSENILPQVIILYGPPAAGKGTQAHYLDTLLPDYYHLDFGTELRKFITTHIGDYNGDDINIHPDSSTDLVAIAKSLKSDMRNSLPAKTSDLRFVVEQAFIDCIARGQGMLVEGPGRLVEEAQWLAGFFNEHDTRVCIFHLHLDLQRVVERSIHRYYLPSSKQPFSSFEEAQNVAIGTEKPYQRAEDEDVIGVTKRYKLLYSDQFAHIISIYQLEAKSLVLTLDANKTVTEVSADISRYLELFFGFSS
jgi:adenylate kinase family enzyme